MRSLFRKPAEFITLFLLFSSLFMLFSCETETSSSTVTYTITYAGNGGTLSDGKTVSYIGYTDNYTVTLPENTGSDAFVRTGYSFAGWAVSAESETLYKESETLTGISSDMTLYAVWSANEYTVTFIGNGGAMDDGTTEYMSTDVTFETVLANSFIREGYSFIGWAETADGEVVYNPDDTYSDTDDKLLYAVWFSYDDIVIDGVTYSKTSFAVVTGSTVTITGSDDNAVTVTTTEFGDTETYEGVFVAGRNVTLSPYAIGKYEVTAELFEAVMNVDSSCSYAENELSPVVCSWYDAIAFCNKLSIMMGLEPCYSIKVNDEEIDWENLSYTSIPEVNSNAWNSVTIDIDKTGYRLPTEAEWEFAARGGDQSADAWSYTYAGSDTVADVAWYTSNSSGKTHEVGLKAANALGIYDMSGNVFEFCQDWYGVIGTGNETDPMGASSGSYRVQRGGSWFFSASYAAVSCRYYSLPYYRFNFNGFRLARSL